LFDTLDYGIVGFYRDREGVVHTAAAGWAAPGEKMTADRIFNIGSLTKTFTAVLILQEIEKGNLRLTDTIGRFFRPDEVNTRHLDLTITIENLLRHTSGLGELIVDTIVNDCFMNPYCPYNNPLN